MKTKTVIFLMGPSGCGKSTLERNLTKQSDRFGKVISTTTRSHRIDEVDGEDYYFVDSDTFDTMLENDEFIQTTEFSGNRYGTTKAEYEKDYDYLVLAVTPKSAATFIPVLQKTFPLMETCLIYFDISKNKLQENMRHRGDAEAEILIRTENDDLAEQMTHSGLSPTITVHDEDLTLGLSHDLLYIIENLYK